MSRMLYLLYASFAAKGNTFGYGVKPRGSTILKIENALARLSEMHMEIKQWTIENLDFRELLRRYDSENSFFYLDPPYHEVQFYRHYFTNDDFGELSSLLLGLKGKYLLNVNRDPFVLSKFWPPKLELYFKNFCYNTKGNSKRSQRAEFFY